jgi:hypothetical protein
MSILLKKVLPYILHLFDILRAKCKDMQRIPDVMVVVDQHCELKVIKEVINKKNNNFNFLKIKLKLF